MCPSTKLIHKHDLQKSWGIVEIRLKQNKGICKPLQSIYDWTKLKEKAINVQTEKL